MEEQRAVTDIVSEVTQNVKEKSPDTAILVDQGRIMDKFSSNDPDEKSAPDLDINSESPSVIDGNCSHQDGDGYEDISGTDSDAASHEPPLINPRRSKRARRDGTGSTSTASAATEYHVIDTGNLNRKSLCCRVMCYVAAAVSLVCDVGPVDELA